MRNGLLSIGEVSRLKDVSAKALRYYERLGVFDPAYVDPHSGYRYYSLNQMFDLDVILTCVELGIPLKDLLDYRTERGTLDLHRLLETGRSIAVENIKRAEASLRQIDTELEEIMAQKRFQESAGTYRRTMPARRVISMPWAKDGFDAALYLKAMTDLYAEAKRKGATPLFFQGMAIDSRDGALGCSLYLEIHEEDVEGAATVDPGAFEGWRIEATSPTACFNDALDQARREPGSYFACEIWDAELPPDTYVVEVLRRL